MTAQGTLERFPLEVIVKHGPERRTCYPAADEPLQAVLRLASLSRGSDKFLPAKGRLAFAEELVSTQARPQLPLGNTRDNQEVGSGDGITLKPSEEAVFYQQNLRGIWGYIC